MTDFAPLLSATATPVRTPAFWRAAHELRRRQTHRTDPARYFQERLGRNVTPGQRAMLESVRDTALTMVLGAHSVGKSFGAAGVVRWRYDNFRPSTTITTAPSKASVHDILWRDIRGLSPGHPDLMPKADRMECGSDHLAVGMTADSGEGFQGRKSDKLLIIFDECVGIEADYWTAADGMLTGPDCRMLAMCNPTDPSSEAYRQIESGRWNVIRLSAFDHPNIAAELAGLPAPFPGAVRLSWLDDKVRAWCKPVDPGQRSPLAVEWPPKSGQWHEPDARFESRVLARWPSKAAYSVWDLGVFNAACARPAVYPVNTNYKPIIGCDPARFGDDLTAIVIRRGPNVVYAETFGKQSLKGTLERLKALAELWALKHGGCVGKQVEIYVDEEGLGAGLADFRGHYNIIGVKSSLTAANEDEHPNVRSELWFSMARRAEHGGLTLSTINESLQSELRKQALAPVWKLDAKGRRVVEPKEQTKRRLGGASPDLMDALNLCFYEPGGGGMLASKAAPGLPMGGALRGDAPWAASKPGGR